MLEIYEIVWRNENVTDIWNIIRKQINFKHIKRIGKSNPRGLFGILKISDVVEDSRKAIYK